LAAGKDVYIEWPIASNTEDSEDIVNLSKGKMVIGLQGHQDPAIRKLKELVESGRIGKVLSSTFTGYGGSASLSTAAESGPVYFYDRVIGGNFISIIYGHGEPTTCK
jgi:predicted dehydrogenase